VSVTIDPAILEAIEAAPIPYDFFREVHKGLRTVLFDLTAAAGRADYTDPAERDAVIDRVHAAIELLHSHHHHEDQFIQPLLERHAPRIAAIVAEGHEEVSADLIDIELTADKLVGAGGRAVIADGLALYHTLAMFTARYLAHMSLEEGDVMGSLRNVMSTAELFTTDMELRAAVPPPMMLKFAAVMLPAMNVDERTAMLGGIRAGAPAEAFEAVRAVAESTLSLGDYVTVAARLGL
jgi:hypothetical protein